MSSRPATSTPADVQMWSMVPLNVDVLVVKVGRVVLSANRAFRNPPSPLIIPGRPVDDPNAAGCSGCMLDTPPVFISVHTPPSIIGAISAPSSGPLEPLSPWPSVPASPGPFAPASPESAASPICILARKPLARSLRNSSCVTRMELKSPQMTTSGASPPSCSPNAFVAAQRSAAWISLMSGRFGFQNRCALATINRFPVRASSRSVRVAVSAFDRMSYPNCSDTPPGTPRSFPRVRRRERREIPPVSSFARAFFRSLFDKTGAGATLPPSTPTTLMDGASGERAEEEEEAGARPD
mmetsp:Transcript_38731/g.91434  ORF Transcript_38731/g.91434 Transcript_38731/m.91434 type:complete len:296 (+) Transcript_38731:157-1044(+)